MSGSAGFWRLLARRLELRGDRLKIIISTGLLLILGIVAGLSVVSDHLAGHEPRRDGLVRLVVLTICLFEVNLFFNAWSMIGALESLDLDPKFGDYGVRSARFIDKTFPSMVARHSRASRPISVLAIDLDDLKAVNDQFGHLAGDRALKEICYQFGKHFRGGFDVLCHSGGDEFLAILSEAGQSSAAEAAERLRRAIERCPLSLGKEKSPVWITVSIGVSTIGVSGSNDRELIAMADAAAYRAKAAGRNRVVVADG